MTANNVSLEITYSSHFTDWLAEHRLSLALTTYQTNRLFLLGLKPDGRLSAFERLFNRPMALHVTDSDRFYLSTQSQLWQLDNALSPNNPYNGYDKLYVPRQATTTGNLDIHDLTVDQRGQILFANTLYSCLSTLSERYSFKPLWCPHFISSLQPEDRCHLNGLALVEGEPRYVTTISRSDTPNGWREQRHEGGCVIEVPGSETVLTDLSMPHSPRWYRNKLWLLQAGSGDFGYVDLERGRFEPVAFCSGYLRGLAFHDYWAIVGLSKPRYNSTFSGLALDKRLTATTQQSHCGLLIINLNTGQIAHWLRFEGVVNELYDVQVLPGVRQPMALGFKTDEIQHLIAVDQSNSVALHQIISTQNPVSVASPSLPKQPYRLQVSHKVMLSTVMINYKTLILPQLQQRLQNQSGQLPLTVVTATRSTQTLGLILAASHPDGDSAEVLSLFVAPEHRRQGLGLTLLTTLENILANKNCNRLNLVYQTNWPDIAAIEGLLQKSGWSLPQTHML
ncbi:MAG: TIGR03032 family protein, partial [Chloroflexi bacterium]|nr:TIGR03032 family protein [Chloroflexota bacterium]